MASGAKGQFTCETMTPSQQAVSDGDNQGGRPMEGEANRPGFSTRAIHAGEHADPATRAHNTPIYQTSTYQFGSLEDKAAVMAGEVEGWVYTRGGNPTTSAIEKKIADLEGAEAAVAGASGMAVIAAALHSLGSFRRPHRRLRRHLFLGRYLHERRGTSRQCRGYPRRYHRSGCRACRHQAQHEGPLHGVSGQPVHPRGRHSGAGSRSRGTTALS